MLAQRLNPPPTCCAAASEADHVGRSIEAARFRRPGCSGRRGCCRAITGKAGAGGGDRPKMGFEAVPGEACCNKETTTSAPSEPVGPGLAVPPTASLVQVAAVPAITLGPIATRAMTVATV